MRCVNLQAFVICCLLVGCATSPANETLVTSAASQSDTPFPTPTPIELNRTLFDKKPQYISDRLVELKYMPTDPDEPSGDAIYDGLKHHSYYALPYLVNKITDTQPAENPTGAPFMSGLTYRVGDTAVLMLMHLENMYWPKGMLPKKYEDMFETEGMFAYYFYVDEVPGGRKEIQRWWKKWLKTCQPDCAQVPSLVKELRDPSASK